MTMQRLLPHYVIEFYQAANVVPMNNGYLRFDPDMRSWCACALTACYLAYHPSQSPEHAFGLTSTQYFDDDTVYAEIIKPWLVRQQKLHPSYLNGFMSGYDDPIDAGAPSNLDPQFNAGYTDGKNAWIAVQQLGGVLV